MSSDRSKRAQALRSMRKQFCRLVKGKGVEPHSLAGISQDAAVTQAVAAVVMHQGGQ